MFGSAIANANENFKKLTMSHCEMTIASCYELLHGLKMNSNLSYIDLSHNDFRSGASSSAAGSKATDN